jgi:glycyl-tRNA synthetase
VTLRELHTTKQIRISIEEVGKVIRSFSEGSTTWEDALAKYPVFEYQAEEEKKE